MDEHIDDFERRLRIKELQLALLRGDITREEHDRRRARYVIAAPPSVAPVWIEGAPAWHGTAVLIVFCVLLPFGLPWLGLALWFFFGR